VELLPPDQAAPLWQAALAEAQSAMTRRAAWQTNIFPFTVLKRQQPSRQAAW
jgi:hypothetical protein